MMERWLHSAVGLQELEAMAEDWVLLLVAVAHIAKGRLTRLGRQYLPGAGCTVPC